MMAHMQRMFGPLGRMICPRFAGWKISPSVDGEELCAGRETPPLERFLQQSNKTVRFPTGSRQNCMVSSVLYPRVRYRLFSGGSFYEGFTDAGTGAGLRRKIYGAGDTEVRALDGVDLAVENGEFVAVVGTSGSGKSTLLHMLGGLDRPTDGKVYVDGNDIFALKDDELTIFRRRRIGFVFQAYNLVPVLSVYENIVLPIELDGGTVDRAYVDEIIRTLGLESKLSNLPSQLSGGQQQRVAIARALATKPAIILADEPTGNLDSKTSQDVLALLKVTSEKFGQTIVMITHNEEIAQLAHRIVRIEDGRIVHS